MSEASGTSKAASTRAALGIFGTKAVLFPLQLFIAFFIIGDLGAAKYGGYRYFLLAIETVLPLTFLGFGGGITYCISSGKHDVRDVVVTSILIGLFHGLITAGLMALSWYVGLEITREISFQLMVPVLAVLPLYGITLMMYRTLMGASWFSMMNVYTGLGAVVTPLLLLALVIVARLELLGAVISIAVTGVILCVFTVAVVWKRSRPRWTLNTAFLRDAYHYGLRDWIGGLAGFTNLRFDQLLIVILNLKAEILGVYGAATKVTELIWMAPDAIGPVLYNRIAQTRDLLTRAWMTGQIHRIMLAFVLVLTAGVAATAWVLPHVFGSDYAGIEVIIWVLLPGTVAFVTTKVLTKFFGGSNQPEKSSIAHTIGAFVTVGLGLVLIPWMGGLGAALTSTLAYCTIALTVLVLFHRMTAPNRVHLFRFEKQDRDWVKQQVREALKVWRTKFNTRKTNSEA